MVVTVLRHLLQVLLSHAQAVAVAGYFLTNLLVQEVLAEAAMRLLVAEVPVVAEQ